jgi:hypothetical protein
MRTEPADAHPGDNAPIQAQIDEFPCLMRHTDSGEREMRTYSGGGELLTGDLPHISNTNADEESLAVLMTRLSLASIP